MNDYRTRWGYFMFVTGIIWMLQGIFTALNAALIQQLSGIEGRMLASTIYSFSESFTWWLLTPLVFVIVKKFNSKSFRIWKTIILHILISIALASMQRLVNIFITFNLMKITGAVDPSLLKLSNFFGTSFIRNTGNGILVYFVISAILYGYLYYIKTQNFQLEQSKLQSELTRIKLENLKYQFQPHFLFNSLQSVSTLMHRDLNLADQAFGDLGDLLRHQIRTIDSNEITLGEELLFLQKYIDLQKTRFGSKLTSEIKCDEILLNHQVPSFLLQPIVENSIKHGIETTGSSIHIQIDVNFENDQLIIKCLDDGLGEQIKMKNEIGGMGITNIRSRLEALYGSGASIETKQTDHGYQTTITIIDNSKPR